MTASTFCLASAGSFFFLGLAFGAWKYVCIARSEDAQAPPYVDIAHRAALLYSFACGLLAQLCRASAWSDAVNLAAAVVLVLYFAAAVLGYAVHGALRDTDNQLRRPHRLGTKTIGNRVMLTFMVSLIAAEIGAFLVIFTGFLVAASAATEDRATRGAAHRCSALERTPPVVGGSPQRPIDAFEGSGS